MLAQYATQPKPGSHLRGHGHPDDASLFLHPDLVGLHLAQIMGLGDEMLVHPLALLPSPLLPTADRAFVYPEGHHDGLGRTAVRQQGSRDDDDVLGGTQAVEGRALARREGLPANMTDVAAIFPTVHTDIAFAALSPCRTVQVVAECRLRVRGDASFLTWRSD